VSKSQEEEQNLRGSLYQLCHSRIRNRSFSSMSIHVNRGGRGREDGPRTYVRGHRHLARLTFRRSPVGRAVRPNWGTRSARDLLFCVAAKASRIVAERVGTWSNYSFLCARIMSSIIFYKRQYID